MKKIVAFVGSARKRHTYDAVHQFLRNVHALGPIESEVVRLSDCVLKPCRGCLTCFGRGEEFCPLDDDRDLLMGKMMAADAVVFATPTYSFQVSGTMKLFLDRLGFVFHRPRYFGKLFTSIVIEGIYGGRKVREYLDFVGRGLGFTVVKGSCMMARDDMTDTHQQKVDRILAGHSARFHAALGRSPYPAPTFMNLMIFRMSRVHVRALDDGYLDHRYFRDHGWFESDYFYPTRLNVVKKAAGHVFDHLAARSAQHAARQEPHAC